MQLTDSIYPGLRLDQEVRAVCDQALGDTVLIRDGDELVGMAVCHCGPATEAGADACYIKFGAAKPGRNTATYFNRLLDACQLLAHKQGRLVGGVSLALRPSRLCAGKDSVRTCSEYRCIAPMSRATATGMHGQWMTGVSLAKRRPIRWPSRPK